MPVCLRPVTSLFQSYYWRFRTLGAHRLSPDHAKAAIALAKIEGPRVNY